MERNSQIMWKKCVQLCDTGVDKTENQGSLTDCTFFVLHISLIFQWVTISLLLFDTCARNFGLFAESGRIVYKNRLS